MEEALRTLLLSSTSVTDLVGTRVNFGAHPQGAPLPGVVMYVIDDAEDHTLTGPDGLSVGRVQIDCWAETYGGAKTVSRAVRGVLDGHSGGDFDSVFLIASRDSRESGTNEATRPFRVSLDFTTNWRA